MNEFYRGRRLRRNPVIREMVRETQLSAADLMMLYFVVDTTDEDLKKEILIGHQEIAQGKVTSVADVRKEFGLD